MRLKHTGDDVKLRRLRILLVYTLAGSEMVIDVPEMSSVGEVRLLCQKQARVKVRGCCRPPSPKYP